MIETGVRSLALKQGFVTHLVVVRSQSPASGEKAALRLADLVVRANG